MVSKTWPKFTDVGEMQLVFWKYKDSSCDSNDSTLLICPVYNNRRNGGDKPFIIRKLSAIEVNVIVC